MTSETDRELKNLTDNVNGPVHYNMGTIECIEFIEDQGFGYHLGNAIKYLVRCRFKGSEREDLEKAIWYINRHISTIGDDQ